MQHGGVGVDGQQNSGLVGLAARWQPANQQQCEEGREAEASCFRHG
jgi:hypothetical protein